MGVDVYFDPPSSPNCCDEARRLREENRKLKKALEEIIALGPTLRITVNQDRLVEVNMIARMAMNNV